METKNIILIAIAVLVVALIAIVGFGLVDNNSVDLNSTNATNATNMTNTTNITNDTSKNVNDTNKTYKVYNPQTDSYVEVIGEAYDEDVGRWYTYDTDGVRYYNTRIWA